MPCWTIQTSAVTAEFQDLAVLRDALQANGYVVSHSVDQVYANKGREFVEYRHSTKQLTGNALDAAQVKRWYAAETVRRAAKKFGWTLTDTTPSGNQRNYKAQKRSY